MKIYTWLQTYGFIISLHLTEEEKNKNLDNYFSSLGHLCCIPGQ